MTILARFADLFQRPTVSAAPAFFRSRRGADTSGLALNTETRQKPEEAPRLTLSELASLREALSRDRQKALARMDCAEVRRIEADTREVTMMILKGA